ncbi:MAG: leucyl aminopeptidase [Halofilum sp. (in: g-proteobacteria)]
MDFSVTATAATNEQTDAVVIGVFEHRRLSPAGDALDRASEGYLRAILESGDIDGDADSSLLLHNVPGVCARRVLLVGCGKPEALDLRQFQRINAVASRVLQGSGASSATNCLTDLEVQGADLRRKARAVVEASAGSGYRFDECKSEAERPAQPLSRIALGVDDAARAEVEAGVAEARAISAGLTLTKDLANRPANICTPAHLAEQAEALAHRFERITTSVLEEAGMAELGMGALLSVSQGSRQPAKLITMEYRGAADAKAKPFVFVGKGVTFDTGGISIKPSAGMEEMKFDMGGAASVFGLIRACAEMNLPANVIGLVPAVENMPDGNAIRPGDIVTSLAGKTIEIINTDAEGRLILCDALTYAQRFEPETIIDIATLTGACVVALGSQASALMTPNDALAQELFEAGEASGDRCWRLPLWEEYQDQLHSAFADFTHVGGRDAGSITAGCFLWRFARDYERWAHFDIAGTAWNRGEQKGATGRPLPLLMQYLLDRVNA